MNGHIYEDLDEYLDTREESARHGRNRYKLYLSDRRDINRLSEQAQIPPDAIRAKLKARGWARCKAKRSNMMYWRFHR